MIDEPLLSLEQLATVLKVPQEMVRDWQQRGILPSAQGDAEESLYSRAAVVRALRDYPDVMTAIKAAMRRHDA